MGTVGIGGGLWPPRRLSIISYQWLTKSDPSPLDKPSEVTLRVVVTLGSVGKRLKVYTTPTTLLGRRMCYLIRSLMWEILGSTLATSPHPMQE